MHRTFVPDMPSMSGIPIAWKNLTSSEQTGAWFNVLLRSIVARLANLDAFDVARTLSVALVAWWLLSTVSMYVQKPNAPVVGWSYRWEPRFVANFRFFFWPKALLTQGYAKVQCSCSLHENAITDSENSSTMHLSGLLAMTQT